MSRSAEPVVVLRHSLGRSVAVIGWLATAAWVVTAWPPSASGLMFGAGASGLLWVTCWRPAVRLDDDAVTVRNPVRDVRIGWSALDEATFDWALRLRAGDVTCRAAAAPGPASMSALYDRHVTVGGVIERDAIGQAGKRPAPALLAVRQRWSARRSSPSGGVSVTPARIAVTVLVLSVALLSGALLTS